MGSSGEKRELLFVRKTADKSITSSTALENDDHLLLSVAANSTYIVDLMVFVDGATTGDFRCGFDEPTGATFTWGQLALINTATAASGSMIVSAFNEGSVSGGPTGTAGAGTKMGYRIRGLLRTAGTAGTLQMKWAQGTSDPTATTVFTDSFMTAQKVG